MEGMIDNGKAMLELEELDPVSYGMKILKKKLEFNKRVGFTKAHDRLPEFFYSEPLPPHNEVFDVPLKEIKKVFRK